ncbi:MAG: 50S ribosomal protein L24 [SAR324 cluster bacterium]|nr:50S ribosomal protein L24 [SAR324 cluster bacterium]
MRVSTKKVNRGMIRVGDEVQVITGKDKDHRGKVLKIDWNVHRILVEGANKVHHHNKPNQQNQQGQISIAEAPIHYSNVLLFCKVCSRGVRVRVDLTTPKAKKRICVKCSNIIE